MPIACLFAGLFADGGLDSLACDAVLAELNYGQPTLSRSYINNQISHSHYFFPAFLYVLSMSLFEVS